ncbi:hypothetical protein CKY39_20575 [Variovorax boronicumulans]|uniref:Uncharacterized protein n=1 Tax=Variovorax boronicumulans TaxID=436515 RepID=A0A250DM62_9BURK|nr:hypothetical protein [Variovorax boronicumulans]ATA55344.1 hypothetical protein CKY39_20575 [Variovorax boronicumulans]
MANIFEKSQYVIPRGRVFFDLYDAADQLTGERHLGNCPTVTLSIATEKAPHYSAESGPGVKDANRVVRIDRTGKITCDNMSADNRAMFISGEKSTVAQTAVAVPAEEIAVSPGLFYQLGRTDANPAGARKVAEVVVTPEAGGEPYVLGEDYTVDAALGRLQVLASGSIPKGKIKVAYSKPATTWLRIKSGDKAELRGALRVLSNIAEGEQSDTYCPLVTLAPTGDMALVTSDDGYVQMEFDIEVLTPPSGVAIFVDGRPVGV